MPTISYPIDKYWLYHRNADYTTLSAYILLYRPPPDSASPCASLRFYRDGATIPASSDRNGRLSLNYHENQLADVTETLRREKPLRVYYSTSSHRGFLTTGREPAGEEEPD